MRNKAALGLVLALSIVWMTSGCSQYSRLAKKGTLAQKDSAATYYFSKKQYDKAHYLYEELVHLYSAKERYHEVYKNWVYCKYHLGDLVGAMFYFEDYASKYPSSKYAQDFAYMGAFCTYLMSDPYELDQRYTYQAIEKFQLYLGRYPGSEHMADCEKYIRELIEKLAKKSFEQARLYLKIGHYKAGVQGFQNMLDEHPDSELREEASYLQYVSSVNLARVSVNNRKRERYEESFEYFKRFELKFPGSKFANQAANLNKAAEKEYQKFLAEEKLRKELELFNSFKGHVQATLGATRKEDRSAEYGMAMADWQELQVLNAESRYIKKASKYFEKLDEAKSK